MNVENGVTTPPAMTIKELKPKMELHGKVKKVELYGAFVDVGVGTDGLLHISELTSGYVGSPSDVVKIGQEVEVRVIKVNSKKKQIDLSMKAAEEPVAMPEDEDTEEVPTAMELALRRAMQGTDMAAEFEA